MKMDTTELFEFCFVDREQERQILNNFFNNAFNNLLSSRHPHIYRNTRYIIS